jgi:hypothetical protein
MIEFNIIYSDVYETPTLYFLITDLELNNLVSFDNYLIQLNKQENSASFAFKNYEVSKIVLFSLSRITHILE